VRIYFRFSRPGGHDFVIRSTPFWLSLCSEITVPVALIPACLPADATLAFLRRASVRTLFITSKRYARSREAVGESVIPEERVYVLHGHVEGKTSLSDLIGRTPPTSADTASSCRHFGLHHVLEWDNRVAQRSFIKCAF